MSHSILERHRKIAPTETHDKARSRDDGERVWRQAFQRARLAVEMATWRTALTLLEECLRDRPDDADALGLYGLCLAREGHDLARAYEACRRAVESQPFEAAMHTSLGCVYLAMGMYPPAVSCFHTALRLDPHDAVAGRGLASALHPQRHGGDLVRRLLDG
ncbi:MAG: tetratricopeptide repeat protein [Candidatus Latescibacterota bacterium]|nr:MAG: tetratricopeptide repeat protein [Candidatus Latescibacterota bacterium]